MHNQIFLVYIYRVKELGPDDAPPPKKANAGDDGSSNAHGKDKYRNAELAMLCTNTVSYLQFAYFPHKSLAKLFLNNFFVEQIVLIVWLCHGTSRRTSFSCVKDKCFCSFSKTFHSQSGFFACQAMFCDKVKR